MGDFSSSFFNADRSVLRTLSRTIPPPARHREDDPPGPQYGRLRRVPLRVHAPVPGGSPHTGRPVGPRRPPGRCQLVQPHAGVDKKYLPDEDQPSADCEGHGPGRAVRQQSCFLLRLEQIHVVSEGEHVKRVIFGLVITVNQPFFQVSQVYFQDRQLVLLFTVFSTVN